MGSTILRHSPTLGTGSSLAKRAANDTGRTPRLEERIAAIGCGIEAIQGRAFGGKNRGTSANHPCTFEETAAEIVVRGRLVGWPVSPYPLATVDSKLD